MTDTSNIKSNDTLRWVMVVTLVIVAFFGAYRFASARTEQTKKVSTSPAVAGAATPVAASGGGQAAAAGSGTANAGAACACCGGGAPTQNGVTGPPTEGAAVLDGGVQRIAVDVTSVYSPNTIKLKAGVPAEITFSQAQGCTQVVESTDLGFSEDLSSGAKTVKLTNLQPGTYAFSCGMQMVFGQIVVE